MTYRAQLFPRSVGILLIETAMFGRDVHRAFMASTLPGECRGERTGTDGMVFNSAISLTATTDSQILTLVACVNKRPIRTKPLIATFVGLPFACRLYSCAA